MTASAAPGLRQRKKAHTRRAIQAQAMRLFLAKGYEATTVKEIARAAGVSHMTFFRHFPTKEDVVLADDYDPVTLDLIGARPTTEAPADKIRHALVESLTSISAADRDALLERTRLVLGTPALRARLWQNQADTQELMVRALSPDGSGEADLQTRVVVAACLAAVTTAILIWVEQDGVPDLPMLIDHALIALRRGLLES